ncbi:MAG: DUF3300 domain-containing protein [Azoarcus sp.]|nr:DUF3300 domain-containing protein [Azoarcus sp.]
MTPASPKVVYVPVYDPYIVYGTWWWPTRPIYWRPPSGVWLTSGFYWSNHYYPSAALWGGFDWGLGVMIINAPVYYGYYRIRPSSRSNYVWRSTSHRPLVDGRRYSSPRRSVAPGGAGVRPPRPSASGRPGAHPHRGGGGGGYRGGGRRP